MIGGWMRSDQAHVFGGIVFVLGALLACKGGAEGTSQSKSAGSHEPGNAGSGENVGGAKAKAPEKLPKIGDTVSFDDSDWVVLSAKDLGKVAKSNNPFQESKKSEGGKFIQVSFKVTNKTKKEERVLGGLKIADSSGREFESLDDQAFYVPNGKKTIGLEAMPSSLAKEFWAVFEVPADATGLRLGVRQLAAMGDTKLVDLGLDATPSAAASGDKKQTHLA
ncbi:MAG: hypothetical protein IT374_27725 [Polyangiaceae bacterium]|nr:hypothetical protein [Polyangiaceae bacterium]